MPTYTITPPCHHVPPLDSLSSSLSTSLSVPKRQVAAQRREQVPAGARNRTFGMYRPILKQPFPSSHFKGRGNISFSCGKFTKLAWCLAVRFCSVQHGEADLPLLGKLFHTAKARYCCETFQPRAGFVAEWQRTGATDCWWGAGGIHRRNEIWAQIHGWLAC